MSTRTNLRPQIVINAGSMAGNLTSSPTILQSLTRVAYSIVWSGTSPVGTLSIQGSGDYSVDSTGTVLNAGTWTTMTFYVNGAAATSAPVTGNTGNGIIDISTAVYAIRLVYTRASGTGTMTATINAKVS